MKALSLTQPWATLVSIGAKSIETRSWSTAYRGPIAVHAARRFPGDARLLCSLPTFGRSLVESGINNPGDLPLGAIIAVARLNAVDEIDTGYAAVVRGCSADGLLPPNEVSFGNYRPGRYAWQLEGVHRLATPVPCHGMLGLWEIPADVNAAIDVQLAAGVVR